MANMFRCTLASGGALVLTVTCDYRFSGSLITCTNGTKTYTRTCPSTSPYEVTFSSISIGTWTVSGEFEGVIYSEQIVISNFTLNLLAGFNYKHWVTLGGLDPTDYASLSDVFADEVAVRRLMTIHASSDYLIEKVTDDIDTIDDFTANDTAMKWIGLRDYVCDGLTAITGVEAKFLASQYWERYLKDHVPVMTSNNAPYGEASISGTVSNPAYIAFNGDAINSCTASGAQSLTYKFTNPVNVKRIKWIPYQADGSQTFKAHTVTFYGSNDNSTWTTLGSKEVAVTDKTNELTLDIPNNTDYFLYYKATPNQANAGNYTVFCSLQYYGRELSVSVPTMTSNTAPYGQAFASSFIDNNRQPYHAFNNVLSTGQASSNIWHSGGAVPQFVGYKSTSAYCVKYARLRTSSYHKGPKTAKLQGSNDSTNGTDGTWVDIGDFVDCSATATWYFKQYNSNNNDYLWHRLYVTESNFGHVAVDELQLYGVDYSEREFAEGSTMKYLYDHGVELETFIAQKGSSTTSVSPSWNGEELYFPLLVGTDNNRNNFSFYETSYDLTNFDLLRATFGFDFKICFSMSIFSSAQSSGTYGTNEAIISPTSITSPNTDLALDISAINQTKYIDVGVMYVNGRSGSIKELWLE